MSSGNGYRVAVITASDRGSAGLREDASGPLVGEMAREAGYEVVSQTILPDDQAGLEQELIRLCDGGGVDMVLTTGGTGFSPRDRMPEATMAVADRAAPGIAEAMRAASMRVTNRAMLSRAASAIRGRTLIINLPGSPKAVRENLAAVLPALAHGLEMLTGRGGECAQEANL